MAEPNGWPLVPVPPPPVDADAAMIAVLLRTILQRLDAQDREFAEFVAYLQVIVRALNAPPYQGLVDGKRITFTPVRPGG